jgi:MFS family permease
MRKMLVFSGAVVFADTLFLTALTPLLPHFAHTLGMSKPQIGVLAACFPIGCLFGAVPSGIVTVRLGVKRTMTAGLALVSACIVLLGVATSAWELDLARFAHGFASSFTWTGAFVWLLADTPAERRGVTMGAVFACATGGALFGPVLGVIASQIGTHWTFVTVGLASLALVAWAAAMPDAQPESPQTLRAFFGAFRHPSLRLTFWFVVLSAFLFGMMGVLAPLRLSSLGLGAVAIGSAYIVASALQTVANLYLGRLADRFGPMAPLRYGLLASSLVCFLLPWPSRAAQLYVLVVLAGLAFGAFFTPSMALLSHAAADTGVGFAYAFALVNLAWAPGQAAGAAGSAALSRATSDAVPYLLIAVVCALTLAAVWRADARPQATDALV